MTGSCPRLVILAAILALLGVAPVQSQTGRDPLMAVCQGFLSSSGLPTPGNSTLLCGCLVREVQANLSLAEMQSYQASTAAGQPLAPSVQKKITDIATRCLTAAR